MRKNQYEVLLEEIRSIKQRVDDIDMSLEKDREGIQDFQVRLENVETEIKTTRQALNRMVQNVRDRVSEAVEPAIEANNQLKDEVKKQKRIFIQEKKNKLEKFLKKLGGENG